MCCNNNILSLQKQSRDNLKSLWSDGRFRFRSKLLKSLKRRRRNISTSWRQEILFPFYKSIPPQSVIRQSSWERAFINMYTNDFKRLFSNHKELRFRDKQQDKSLVIQSAVFDWDVSCHVTFAENAHDPVLLSKMTQIVSYNSHLFVSSTCKMIWQPLDQLREAKEGLLYFTT